MTLGTRQTWEPDFPSTSLTKWQWQHSSRGSVFVSPRQSRPPATGGTSRSELYGAITIHVTMKSGTRQTLNLCTSTLALSLRKGSSLVSQLFPSQENFVMLSLPGLTLRIGTSLRIIQFTWETAQPWSFRILLSRPWFAQLESNLFLLLRTGCEKEYVQGSRQNSWIEHRALKRLIFATLVYWLRWNVLWCEKRMFRHMGATSTLLVPFAAHCLCSKVFLIGNAMVEARFLLLKRLPIYLTRLPILETSTYTRKSITQCIKIFVIFNSYHSKRLPIRDVKFSAHNFVLVPLASNLECGYAAALKQAP